MAMGMFVIGCIAVMAGAAMVAFGIPVSEFSFGNTLIVSGTTLATGGVVVIALSAVVKELQRMVDAMGGRALAQPPAESFEPPPEARGMPSRAPFPPKPKVREPSQPVPAEPLPVPADLDAESHSELSFAPSLRNPEAPPVTVEDDVSLSPLPPDTGEPRREPASDAPWRNVPPPPPREAPTSYFDSMWPAKPRTATPNEQRDEPKADKPGELSRDNGTHAPAHPPAAEPGAAPRSPVAILKSGVVDGMGYTLYVDGSIEAELPQGTLRFASIDELRAHLEKNG